MFKSTVASHLSSGPKDIDDGWVMEGFSSS